MSLRLKYVLLVIAPLFGIIAVILALGLQAFEENTRETIARELTRSAELHAARIEVLLRKNKKGQISIFSNISQSQDLIPIDPENLKVANSLTDTQISVLGNVSGTVRRAVRKATIFFISVCATMQPAIIVREDAWKP